MSPVLRIRSALAALAVVVATGTVGYVLLGFTPLDALYQTVTTITTVGFREVNPLGPVGKVFTMALILTGVGTALYAFGALIEAFVEGDLRTHLGRRRMDRDISRMHGHVIVCGWGRVGTSCYRYLCGAGQQVVAVDRDPARLVGVDVPHVVGDVTDDRVLRAAGIEHAKALIAALETDADNVYVTLSARALRPDIVIIARARDESSKAKLTRAGANRAVNPQLMGGRRMGAFALQPHVAEFLDVVMHDETLDFRLEQFEVPPHAACAGATMRELAARLPAGALLLALRRPGQPFTTNSTPDAVVEEGAVLIALGTATDLAAVGREIAAPDRPGIGSDRVSP